MKLEVTHKEIVAGLTQFLAAQGITGFDPATCQVTFKPVRGSNGELTAVLDTDPAPAAEAAPAAKPNAGTSEKPKADPAPAAEPEPQPEPEVQTETPAADPAPAGDDDNLFT